MTYLHAVTLTTAIIAIHALSATRVAAQQPPAPDTMVLESSRGRVTFTHRKHAELTECATCHHESKPEKPLTRPNQKCGECHTSPVVAPMKTSRRMAFHDTTKNEGTCLTCHVKAAESGKTAPSSCSGCHKRIE